MTTLAFTGHRPKDLPTWMNEIELTERLDLFLADRDRTWQFVTGGALGIDTWAAEYAIQRDIPLTMILPFPIKVMARYWSQLDQDRLWSHVRMHAQDVQIVHDHDSYDVRAYQLRNEEMVNRADGVIAFWTGKKAGGTANCIRYALKVEKPVINLMTRFRLRNGHRITSKELE